MDLLNEELSRIKEMMGLQEKDDACTMKVKSRYKVWPSAYASGALVKCRKVGAANWGSKSEGEHEEHDVEEAKKTDYSKEKSQGLHGWFSRKGGGGSKGWVDCNTCRKNASGTKTCKSCGRKPGEDRKYPACRPTPASCGTPKKGKKWGKKSNEELNEELNMIRGMMGLNESVDVMNEGWLKNLLVGGALVLAAGVGGHKYYTLKADDAKMKQDYITYLNNNLKSLSADFFQQVPGYDENMSSEQKADLVRKEQQAHPERFAIDMSTGELIYSANGNFQRSAMNKLSGSQPYDLGSFKSDKDKMNGSNIMRGNQ